MNGMLNPIAVKVLFNVLFLVLSVGRILHCFCDGIGCGRVGQLAEGYHGAIVA